MPPVESNPADAKPADGSFQAMDHVANWVRFADTKATILVAGLGVVLTILLAKVDTVIDGMGRGQPGNAILLALAGLTAMAFLWTLFWLLFAIGPRRTSTPGGINRFAWPTMLRADAHALIARGRTKDVREDAWQQVIDLSVLADRKFSASHKAIYGFGAVMVLGAVLVTTSISIASDDSEPPTIPHHVHNSTG